MTDAPAYQRRVFAWWELRSFLAKRLSYDEFTTLLRRVEGPLNQLLWPDEAPSPTMAFDAQPGARKVARSAVLHAKFASGKYDRETNNKIDKFISEILDIEEEERSTRSAAYSMLKTYDALMRGGDIASHMTVTERHIRVIKKLGTTEKDRGYKYENFRLALKNRS
jgi:hypothetical protein